MPFIKKFFGWALLLGGLAIITWSLYSSYNIFTGKTAAPEIFKIEEEKFLPKKDEVVDLEKKIEQVISEQFGKQLKEMIPSDFLPRFFNLVVWSIFAGILIFGGAQISSLGIKLLRFDIK